MKPAIALVGDFSPEVVAHRAIPQALALASATEGVAVIWNWVHTASIQDAACDLAGHSAVWIVPASPYANMDGALAAIRWARETRRPLVGSCGGFQHMLIEFARARAGLSEADTAETNPAGKEPIVTPLACALIGQAGGIHFTPGSQLRAIYGRESATEGYNCSYGLNDAYRVALETAGLRFTAFDESGQIRAAELPKAVHPFFIGTLFQSERAALRGEIPPIARALVHATAAFTP